MLHILVADDSRYQRYLVAQALAGLGDCQEAADGLSACRLFEQALAADQPFDLVVMDILMPEMDGHTALAGIREAEARRGVPEENRVPAVMLSTLADPDNMLRAQFESGAQAYVTKPFRPETLREALATLGLLESPLPSGPDEDPCAPS